MRACRGFTLLETMLAIGVGLAVLAVALPIAMSARAEAQNLDLVRAIGSVRAEARSLYGSRADGYSAVSAQALANSSDRLGSMLRSDASTPAGYLTAADEVRLDLLPGSELRGATGLPATASWSATLLVRASRLSVPACTDVVMGFQQQAEVIRVGSGSATSVVPTGPEAGPVADLAARACQVADPVVELQFS